MNVNSEALVVRSLDALAEIPKTTTLEQVAGHQAITDLGGREDGSLSDKQKLLVATAVSIMQDEISREIRNQRDILIEELRSQRSAFIEFSRSAAVGLLSFAKSGMFTAPKKDSNDDRPLLLRVFTWGNFFAGAAIVLVAVAGYTTHTYLAYKDLADVREKDIAHLTEDVKKQTAALEIEKGKNQSQADAIQDKDNTLAERSAEVTVLKSRLEVKEIKEESDLQKQLSDAQLTAANANATADKRKVEVSALRERLATLNQVVKDKDDEIRQLSAANRDKSRVIESLTDKLADKHY